MEENKTTEMTRTPAHNSVLAKGELRFFKDSSVLKIPPFAKPETARGQAKRTTLFTTPQ